MQIKKAIMSFGRVGVLRGGMALSATAGISGNVITESSIIDLTASLPKHEVRQYEKRDINTINTFIWHHTATNGSTIRSIADYHINRRNWPEIAYHYAIGYDGKIYKLVDENKISFHASGRNKRSIGIALIGNYEDRDMTPAMKSSSEALLTYLKYKHPNVNAVLLHRETKATACPGKFASSYIRSIR